MKELLIALMVFASGLLGRFRRWLTFRHILGLVALLVLALCLKGLIFDLGMGADAFALFAIDWGLALEVSALMIALSVQGHVAAVAHVVRRWLQRSPLNRIMRRAFRRSSRTRPTAPLLPPPPEDEPEAFAGAALIAA